MLRLLTSFDRDHGLVVGVAIRKNGPQSPAYHDPGLSGSDPSPGKARTALRCSYRSRESPVRFARVRSARIRIASTSTAPVRSEPVRFASKLRQEERARSGVCAEAFDAQRVADPGTRGLD